MKITIPTSRSWQVSYFGDLFSNIVDAWNVDLHYSEGKVGVTSLLYPYTTTDDIAAIGVASSFNFSDADNSAGTRKYWAACEALYKTATSATNFALDTTTNSPTGLTDSDIVNWGVTLGDTYDTTKNEIDIMICSTPTSLSLLNYLAAGAFAWINHWWDSDINSTFSSAINSTGNQYAVTVASTAAWANGDTIYISGSQSLSPTYTGAGIVTNGLYSGTGTCNNGSQIITGLTAAQVSTMTVGAAITGTSDIAAGTYIASIVSTTSITITIAATGSGTPTLQWTTSPSTIYNLTTAEMQTMAVGNPISGTDIPTGTTITGLIAPVPQTLTTPVAIPGMATISLNATASASVTLTWQNTSAAFSLNGSYSVVVIDGTHLLLVGKSAVDSWGNALPTTFSGTIQRQFNNTTKFNFLCQTPLMSGVPHVLIPFGSSPELFVTDGYQIHSIGSPGSYQNPTASSDVSYGRLIFKTGYTCTWGCATSLKLYFGLSDNRGSSYPSLIEEYDPFNEQVHEVEVQNGATVGFINDNNLNIIDIKGNLKSYNGNSFDIMGQFPSTEIDGASVGLPHRNGIFVSENRVNMLLNSSGYVPDGWWTYEIDTKRLYHQGAIIPQKTTQDMFGSSYQDTFKAFFSFGLNQIFAGASVHYNIPTYYQSGIFCYPAFLGSPTYLVPIGRITLGKIPSEDIDSVWRNILVKYNPVKDRVGLQTGTIVVKYKTAEFPYPTRYYQGLWVNSTSFTIASSYAANMVVGAEITVTEGDGAGMAAHIVSVSAPSGGFVTVVVTNEYAVSPGLTAGYFNFNLDNFIRMPVTDDITDNTRNWALIDIPETATGEWLQIKLEIRGGFFVEEVQVGVQPNLLVEVDQSRPDGNLIQDR
jgi:hypothetical protein